MLNRFDQLRSRVTDDAGFTVAEALVGMALTGIAGAIGISMFVGVMQQTAEVGAQSQTDESSRVGLNQIANEIRVADSPTSLSDAAIGRFAAYEPYSVTFYSNRQSASRTDSQTRLTPSKVSISREVDPGDSSKFNVVMRTWAPGTTDPQKVTLISDLRNNTTTPTQDDTSTPAKDETTLPAEPLFLFCDSSATPTQTVTTTTTAANPTARCGQTGNQLAYSNDTVANAYRSASDPASTRAMRIASVIVSAKVAGASLENNGGARVPTTWLTTRIALSGHVVAALTGSAS